MVCGNKLADFFRREHISCDTHLSINHLDNKVVSSEGVDRHKDARHTSGTELKGDVQVPTHGELINWETERSP